MGNVIICNRNNKNNISESIITTTSTVSLEVISNNGTHTSKSNATLNDILFDTMPSYILIVFPNIAITNASINSSGNLSSAVDFYKAVTMIYKNETLTVHSTDNRETSSSWYNRLLSFTTDFMNNNFTMSIINNKLVITNILDNDYFAISSIKSNYVIASYCI